MSVISASRKYQQMNAGIAYSAQLSDEELKNLPYHISTLEVALDIIKASSGLLIIHLYANTSASNELNKWWNSCLTDPNIREILCQHYLIFGWCIEDDNCHETLCAALEDYPELSTYSKCVQDMKSTVIIVAYIKDQLTIMSENTTSTTAVDFFNKLFALTQIKLNNYSVSPVPNSVDDVSPLAFQQYMCDYLGNRDYDCFESTQLNALKDKIYFAYCGKSKDSNENAKLDDVVNKAYDTIVRESNLIARYKNQVVIAFIYNYIKLSDTISTQNDSQQFEAYPIFVLRKCECTTNNDTTIPCRVFIDHNGRVYCSWNDYLRNVQLPKCVMHLPKDGHYITDDQGKVLLDIRPSPSSSFRNKVIHCVDKVGSFGGLVAGGTLLASSLLAPPVVLTAGATAAITGMYSVVRSSVELHDRRTHKENMSLSSPEVRGTYLNIAGGLMGALGAGCTRFIARLASGGRTISMATRFTVNGINASNVIISGVGLGDSLYYTIKHYNMHKKLPSTLSLVQLSASVLFFGNAVYSFQSVDRIIVQSQEQTINKHFRSLSKRSGRMLTKLRKETIRLAGDNVQLGNQEIIAYLRTVPDKTTLLSALKRNNRYFNENNVRFAICNNELCLNGVPTNMEIIATMDHVEMGKYVSLLPELNVQHSGVKLENVLSMQPQQRKGLLEKCNLSNYVYVGWKLIQFCHTCIEHGVSETVKNRFIVTLQNFIAKVKGECTDIWMLIEKLLSEYNETILYEIYTNYIITYKEYFEEQRNIWQTTGRSPYGELFNMLDQTISCTATCNHYCKLFGFVFVAFFDNGPKQRQLLDDLWTYFHTWVTGFVYDVEEKREALLHNNQAENSKVPCKTCGGSYYKP